MFDISLYQTKGKKIVLKNPKFSKFFPIKEIKKNLGIKL